MRPNQSDRFLFIHIMKTGGTSFADIIAANFPTSERYPDACIAADAHFFRRMEAYLFTPGLVSDVNALQGKLRMVRGHVPYAVRALLLDSFVAITLLRDPVERTLSYLKHCRRYHAEHQEMPLEEIYEDPWFNAMFISNYQTRIFSMTPEEAISEARLDDGSPRLPSRREIGDGTNLAPDIEAFRQRAPGRVSLECFAAGTGLIDVDERRLGTAMENLSMIDVVGVTDRYDCFLQQLIDRYHWRITRVPHRHAGVTDSVSLDFRKRIAHDNPYDVELYQYARSLSAASG